MGVNGAIQYETQNLKAEIKGLGELILENLGDQAYVAVPSVVVAGEVIPKGANYFKPFQKGHNMCLRNGR